MNAKLLDIKADTGIARHPDPAIVMSGDGSSILWNEIDLGEGALKCGQWIGQPGELMVRPRGHHEMFTVVTGHIELEASDGMLTNILPGQAGFIPKGWTGIWRTKVETRKTYVLLQSIPGEGT